MKIKIVVIPISRAPVTVVVMAESSAEVIPTFRWIGKWSDTRDFLELHQSPGTPFATVDEEINKHNSASFEIEVSQSLLRSVGFEAVKAL